MPTNELVGDGEYFAVNQLLQLPLVPSSSITLANTIIVDDVRPEFKVYRMKCSSVERPAISWNPTNTTTQA